MIIFTLKLKLSLMMISHYKRTLRLHNVVILVRYIVKNRNKYHPQVFLEKYL